MLRIILAPLILLTTCLLGVSALPGPLRLASTFSRITTEFDNISLGNCSLNIVTLPMNYTKTKLPEPSPHLDLKYIALGRGTQNYSCSSTESSHSSKKSATPVAVGAVATLFDASCIASQSVMLLHELPAVIAQTPLGSFALMVEALTLTTNSSNLIIGEHYFNTAGDPFFDLNMSGSDAWMECKKDASVSAPTRVSRISGKDESNVPWLKLDCKDCKGIKEVYRVMTVGGVAPTTCAGQNDTVLVEYAAEYWFYG
ncbi:hypothetical protein N7481_005812 [Penicillium waksmanii]|uniref:uncharacterized protein n=1 Tax=Penicillium waksmanii TaxID=69791 RepID=UPI0025493223|nr:uncharacterized protein N7481_005812 [Penicillium waksmanii]KAJ5983713.1 hypothetical protein N7481_005812 [Penicillium waksmanii]